MDTSLGKVHDRLSGHDTKLAGHVLLHNQTDTKLAKISQTVDSHDKRVELLENKEMNVTQDEEEEFMSPPAILPETSETDAPKEDDVKESVLQEITWWGANIEWLQIIQMVTQILLFLLASFCVILLYLFLRSTRQTYVCVTLF